MMDRINELYKYTMSYINKKENKFKPKGRKNKTINPTFVSLCKKDQKEMKAYLASELSKYYNNVISKDGFLYVKGKDKILLTAHMDTTRTVEYGQRKKVKDVYEEEKDGKHILTSPEGIGGDDRCGIYVILEVLRRTNLRPSIIFCEDEEIGCVGSGKFAESKFIEDLKEMYFLVQIDRRGNDDIVFYSDINEDFHSFVAESTGYTERTGSYTDICKLSPKCNVSSVNLSSGYHNEHHDYESVVLEELEHTLEVTIKLVKDGLEKKEQFEYKVRTYTNYGNYGYGSSTRWNRYEDDYDYYYPTSYLKEYYKNLEKQRVKGYKENEEEKVQLFVQYLDENEEEIEELYEGKDENEAFVNFFFDHPDTCWNDIIDWNVDYSNDYESII